jgi:hypothetical protein
MIYFDNMYSEKKNIETGEILLFESKNYKIF